MRTREISNADDVIDSRDIIKRIEELESNEYRECGTCGAYHKREYVGDCRDDSERFAEVPDGETYMDASEFDELESLRSLVDEASSSPDWNHGETLIRDSYFKEYAEQLADDIGAIDRNASWPLTCIDWDRAADELKQDYFSVDYDGVEYWIRA